MLPTIGLMLLALVAGGGQTARATASEPVTLELDLYAVTDIAVGTPGTTLDFPAAPVDVLSSDLERFRIEFDGVAVRVRPLATARPGDTADLFVTVGGRTYTFECRFDPKVAEAVLEFRTPARTPPPPAPFTLSPSAADGTAQVPPVIFADADAERMPPVQLALGRLTRIDLPSAPVTFTVSDPDLVTAGLRGRDLYVTPTIDAGRVEGARSHILVYLDGGAVLDFDVRVAVRSHRVVFVRSSQPETTTRDGRAILGRWPSSGDRTP